jgi:hypothetical protein
MGLLMDLEVQPDVSFRHDGPAFAVEKTASLTGCIRRLLADERGRPDDIGTQGNYGE